MGVVQRNPTKTWCGHVCCWNIPFMS